MDNLDGKKILLISTSSGSRGGGEIAFMQQAEGLVAQGCHVEMLLSDDARMDELAGQYAETIPIHRIPYRNTYDKRFRFLSELCGRRALDNLRVLLDRHAPHFVHLNKQNLEDGIDWLRVLQTIDVPSAVTIYVPNSMSSLGAKFGKFRDFLLRREFRNLQSTLVTVSEASRSTLDDFLGAGHGTRIEVIPTGVPDVLPGDRAAFRKEWNVPQDTIVLGTIARIETQKNPLFAVRLLAELPEHIRMVWVGDGRLRGQMEELAHELNVAGRLHIDGWRQDATSRLAGFDLFFLPSRYEGFPLAILEAMAAGVPCAVSDVDGNVESVIHEESGLVLPLDKLPVWKQAISGLAVDDAARNRYSEAGRRRYEEHYSVESMTRQTVSFYREALGLQESS